MVRNNDAVKPFWQGNRTLLMLALQKRPSEYHEEADMQTPLCYAAKKLRDDEGVVRAAMEKHRLSFAYASPRLRSDRDLALAAFEVDTEEFEFTAANMMHVAEGACAPFRSLHIQTYTGYINTTMCLSKVSLRHTNRN